MLKIKSMKVMNRHRLLLIAVSLVTLFSACSKDDDDTPTPPPAAQTVLVQDLPADPATRDPNTGAVVGGNNEYTFFRFSDSTIVSHEDSASSKWDIGFRGTDIILNSGTSGPGTAQGQVVNSTLAEITAAPADGYASDDANGHVFGEWYNYNPTTHIVTSVPGYILVIHTADGKYVKVELLSYYKGAPAQPDLSSESRYYTFRYVIQPDGSTNFNEQ
jgi:hypothetical protein